MFFLLHNLTSIMMLKLMIRTEGETAYRNKSNHGTNRLQLLLRWVHIEMFWAVSIVPTMKKTCMLKVANKTHRNPSIITADFLVINCLALKGKERNKINTDLQVIFKNMSWHELNQSYSLTCVVSELQQASHQLSQLKSMNWQDHQNIANTQSKNKWKHEHFGHWYQE